MTLGCVRLAQCGGVVPSTEGSIASLIATAAVAAAILAALGTPWATTASHYLPLAADQAMLADRPSDPGTLSPVGGTLAMSVWVLVSVTTAAELLTTCDAQRTATAARRRHRRLPISGWSILVVVRWWLFVMKRGGGLVSGCRRSLPSDGGLVDAVRCP